MEDKVKKSITKLFVCNICNNQFATKPEYLRHTIEAHKETADVPCPTCGKLFKSEIGMKIHTNIHKDTTFQCNICNMICVTRIRFKKHVSTHVETSPKACPICDKTFSKSSQLRAHQKAIHLKEKSPISCQLCPKTFQAKTNYNNHQKSHRKLTSFDCYICKKFHPTKNVLSIHMSSHLDQKPYLPCPECGKMFSAQHLLRNHISYNHEFTTTKCNICHEVCKTKSLSKHMKGHIEKDSSIIKCKHCFREYKTSNIENHLKSHALQEFTCDKCDYQCSEIGMIQTHVRRSHNEDLNRRCEYCDKIFQNLTFHIKEVHTIVKCVSCNICGQTFRDKSVIKKHTREVHRNERPHSCPDCKKTFKRNSHLKGHLILHSNTKPFKCKFCNASFAAETTLRLHTYIHTNEKPYKCEKCEHAFRQPQHLKSHIFYHHTDEKKEPCNVCHKSFSNMKMHMRNHSSKVYYTCEICQQGFKHQYAFVTHKQRQHGTKDFKCEICFKVFKCKPDLQKHSREIHTQRSIVKRPHKEVKN